MSQQHLNAVVGATNVEELLARKLAAAVLTNLAKPGLDFNSARHTNTQKRKQTSYFPRSSF